MPANLELFAPDAQAAPWSEPIAAGAVLLHGFALTAAGQIYSDLQAVLADAPLRHFVTPGGKPMSVANSSCGAVGWISDRRGYRYCAVDPLSNRPWPAMPASISRLVLEAAAAAGYGGFDPESCLINRYQAGTRLSLHQDRDEKDRKAPIVSISLGLPAIFLFGGDMRSSPTTRHRLVHGDVVVWGGPSRLAFHGVAPLAAGEHDLTGPYRFNLTLRRVA